VDITEYSREQLDLHLGKRIFIGFKAAATAMVKYKFHFFISKETH
jgi:molybdate transport system regulatory protein